MRGNWMLHWALSFLLLSAGSALAETPHGTTTGTVPALSIESLYHPSDRFAYVQSPTPSFRWSTREAGESVLMVRRPDGWKEIDPLAQTESDSAIAQRLVDQLTGLELGDADHVSVLVDKWIGDPDRSLDKDVLVSDGSIALVGLDTTPRWLIKDAAKSWQEVSLSPDATCLAYVTEGDLHVRRIASEETIRVTDDGGPTKLNGILDWVYQEEIYGRGQFRGYWWRSDSRGIAFLSLDISSVGEYPIVTSDSPRGGVVQQRYPKAGDAIPVAELWVASLDDVTGCGACVRRIVSATIDQPVLITRVGWRDDSNDLIFQTANRLQNDHRLWRIDITSDSSPQAILREHIDRWLEISDLPRWLNRREFLRLSDWPGGRRRLWKIDADTGIRQAVTPEDFDVRDVLEVRPDGSAAWLVGDAARGSAGQQLYRVDLQVTDESLEMTQVTDDQMPWHAVTISDDGRWMVDLASSLVSPVCATLSSIDERLPPTQMLWNQETVVLPGSKTPVESEDGAVASEGVPSADAVPEHGWAEVQWVTITTSDGLALPAYVVMPARSGDKPAPVLFEVYGGPLAASVRDQWSANRYLWHQLLAARGIAVIVVDNRSSGGRGLKDSWEIHRRMGAVEAMDLQHAVDWLCEQPWVDRDRIALRGWSFGGFLTLHSMTTSDRFVAGVAGGSVTDWRHYDAIYTERYMGLPIENAAGYDATSPVLAANRLHGRVLLLHGEADDNVHVANTLRMAGALQKAGKPFDMMIYPGEGHSIREPMATYHLMSTTLEFLERHLVSGCSLAGD